MWIFAMTLIAISASGAAIAQTPAPKVLTVATDIAAKQITTFIDALSHNRASDRLIQTKRITGGYRLIDSDFLTSNKPRKANSAPWPFPRHLFSRLLDCTQVGFNLVEAVRKHFLSLFVGYRWYDNHVFAPLPVNRCCYLMFSSELH